MACAHACSFCFFLTDTDDPLVLELAEELARVVDDAWTWTALRKWSDDGVVVFGSNNDVQVEGSGAAGCITQSCVLSVCSSSSVQFGPIKSCLPPAAAPTHPPRFGLVWAGSTNPPTPSLLI